MRPTSLETSCFTSNMRLLARRPWNSWLKLALWSAGRDRRVGTMENPLDRDARKSGCTRDACSLGHTRAPARGFRVAPFSLPMPALHHWYATPPLFCVVTRGPDYEFGEESSLDPNLRLRIAWKKW